jgi:magnesium transporter
VITIFKSADHGMERLDAVTAGAWIKAVDPTSEEIQQLVEWGVAHDYIAYSLDLDELARVERDEGDTFILVRVPLRQPESDVPYITVPLGMLIKEDIVVTICKYDDEIFGILENGKYRLLRTGKRYRFALYVFLETATRYLAHLREINKATEVLEDQLQASTRNREVLELLKYQKSLTYFATALRSNEVMMERVERSRLFSNFEEDRELLEDVLTENQQAIQMTSIATELLAAMMDAFASIISNNLNAVLKILAALTIIVALPGTVAAFFGMNVALPLSSSSGWSFLAVVGISVGLTALAAVIFAKRDWF